MRASEFWDLTYGDIMETIEAYQKAKQAEATMMRDMRAMMDYRLANLIAIGFHEPKKFPQTLSEAYPFLSVSAKQGTWQESKAEMAAIAGAHNRSFKKGGQTA